MRIIALSSIAALVLSGCVQDLSAPAPPEAFPLRATVTADNTCTVEVLGRTYTSIGHVVGATLPTFSGSLENQGYHAIGCWVLNSDGTDGSLLLTFSGDSYQKPFEPGTYMPRFEAPYGSTGRLVSLTFRMAVLTNQRLRTINESTGAVTIEGPLSGAKTIRVDVSVVKFDN